MTKKTKAKVVKRYSYQTGKTTKSKDKKLIAKYPGKRVSKKGNTYYEARKNRSDKNKKRRL